MTRLHSIFISDSLEKIPVRAKINLASLKSAHPGMSHSLYTGETLRYFISTHFDREVVRAYDALGPVACKADLGRYCLLFEYGGVYSDLSLFFFDPVIRMQFDKLHVFQNAGFSETWRVSNALIAARPKMRLFESCIKTIVAQAHENDDGSDASASTGARLFGEALHREMSTSISFADIAWGEEISLPSGSGANRCAYKAPAGNFVAFNQQCANGTSARRARATEGVTSPGTGQQSFGSQPLPVSSGTPDAPPAPDLAAREEEEILALLSIIDANL